MKITIMEALSVIVLANILFWGAGYLGYKLEQRKNKKRKEGDK